MRIEREIRLVLPVSIEVVFSDLNSNNLIETTPNLVQVNGELKQTGPPLVEIPTALFKQKNGDAPSGQDASTNPGSPDIIINIEKSLFNSMIDSFYFGGVAHIDNSQTDLECI